MENQTNPLFLLFSIAIAQFMLLILLVYKKKYKNKYQFFLLSLLILSLTLIITDFLMTWSGYFAAVPQLIGLSFSFIFLLGPILYGLINVAEDKRLHFSYFLHFIPFLISISYQFHFLQESTAYKLDYYQKEIITEQAFKSSRYIGMTILKALFILAYVLWTKWHKRSNDQPWDRINKSIWFIYSIVVILLFIHAFLLSVQWPLYALTYCGIISLFGFLGFWLNWILIFPTPKNKIEKYQKSGLPDDILTKEAQRIQQIMMDQKPYLDPDLKLANLSVIVTLSTHHLSQVINQNFDKNYSDFINEYRIKYAQEKLLSSDKKTTIQEIAFTAGFNSKNSFNRSFKKVVGITPSEFKANAHKSVD